MAETRAASWVEPERTVHWSRQGTPGGQRKVAPWQDRVLLDNHVQALVFLHLSKTIFNFQTFSVLLQRPCAKEKWGRS